MTTESNLLTQHAVPPVANCAPSGSIVFRTVIDVVPLEKLLKEIDVREKKRKCDGSQNAGEKKGKRDAVVVD